jgi:hypothetical protein
MEAYAGRTKKKPRFVVKRGLLCKKTYFFNFLFSQVMKAFFSLEPAGWLVTVSPSGLPGLSGLSPASSGL